MAGSGSEDVTLNIGGDSSGAEGALQRVLSALRSFSDGINNFSLASGSARNSLDSLTGSWNVLNQGILASLGPFGQFLLVAGSVVELATPFINAFEGATNAVMQLGDALINDVVQGAEAAAQEIENLSEQVFQLTEQTEKNYFNWAFVWGGINQATGQGPGLGPANQLLNWSLQASLNMPFTRQDLMSAITTLSIMPGMTTQGVESDLTALSDVAATQGRPGLTLSWAAMAALRGSQGYSRMLLMDLNLSKDTLAKFGYNEKDDATFFPALIGYEKSRGEYGASAYISQNTFWGAMTSFQDRLQNFGLAVGGWNNNPQTLTDDVTKGSFFGALKTDLLDVNKALDDLSKSGVIEHLADLFGSTLGGGVNDARIALEGLANGLQQSGVADWLIGSQTHVVNRRTGKRTDTYTTGVLGDLGNFINDPQTQAGLQRLGDVIGNVIGPAMKDIGEGAQNFIAAFADTGVGQDILAQLQNLAQWLANPQTQASINAFGTALGGLGGGGLQAAAQALQSLAQGLGASGGPHTLLTDLQGISAWFADPTHNAQIKQVAFEIGDILGGAFSFVSDNIKILMDLLTGLPLLIGDSIAVVGNLLSGNLGQAAVDLKRMQTDWQNFWNSYSADYNKLGQDKNAWWNALTNPPNFSATGPDGGAAAGPAAAAAAVTTAKTTAAIQDAIKAGITRWEGSQNSPGDQMGTAMVTAMTNRLSNPATGDALASAVAQSINTQLGRGSLATRAAQHLGDAIAAQIVGAIEAVLGQSAFGAYLTSRQAGMALPTLQFGVH